MGFNSKINGLALCRRIEPNMRCLLPEPGYVFIAFDIISAEMVVQCEYTRDDTLIYQVFEGIGKEPYYRDDGLLMCDDAYIGLCSTNIVTRDKVMEMFTSYTFEGMSFAEAWVVNKDLIKEHPEMKPMRKFNKIICLASSYGLAPYAKKPGDMKHGLQNNMRREGYHISKEQAVAINKAYWDMYPKIKHYKDAMEEKAKQGIQQYNQFGFPLTGKPKDMYNRLCQSSVEDIMNLTEMLLEDMFQERFGEEYQHLLTTHDEGLCTVREELGEATCELIHEVSNVLNGMLGWSFPIRFDPKIAKDFYECK